MITNGIGAFTDKKILLLQGPVGPFFAYLSRDLQSVGAQVFKVNFNAGDWLFYPCNAFNYQDPMDDFPAWFELMVEQLALDVIILFGDCRPIHRAAHAIASRRGLEIGVFEEGYIRPDYITFERFGVNGYSTVPRAPEYYFEQSQTIPHSLPVGSAYWRMVWYGILYFTIGALGKPLFRHYRHHRPLTLLEALPWVRSVWRKQRYRWVERGIQRFLINQWDNRYFLAPLQVFNDAQIIEHTGLESVEHFIETTLHSFARHAPADTLLVFKHHPMDRGYKDYSVLINKLVNNLSIDSRVYYIHDQHLPTLLKHARGVVIVNSTVGLSSLHHNIPTKVCGNALYDFSGLTYQGSLDKFWRATNESKPDRNLYFQFLSNLITKTQLNGSFYKQMKASGTSTGLKWCEVLRHKGANAAKTRHPSKNMKIMHLRNKCN